MLREFDLDRDEVRLLDWDPDAEIRIGGCRLIPVFRIDQKEELAEVARSR